MDDFKLSEQQQQVLTLLLNNVYTYVCLMGKAGTGKSRVILDFMAQCQRTYAVCAFTGNAALNVGGVTVHSLFGLEVGVQTELRSLSDNQRALLKNLAVIVIDEASMLRADFVDAIDLRLRQCTGIDRPFGGKQMILVGDPYQLEPVTTDEVQKQELQHLYGHANPYFFQAKVWQNAKLETIHLTTIFRQSDPRFIEALNNVRTGDVTDGDLDYLNQHVKPRYSVPDDCLIITTTKKTAENANNAMLDKLTGDGRVFRAEIFGNFPEQTYPTDLLIQLKVGARVMFAKNDKVLGVVNGTRGIVTSLDPLHVAVGDRVLIVEEATWERIILKWDAINKCTIKITTASFTQIPLRLAAAITGHRAQGATFEKVYLDFGYTVFATGGAYVMLSRVTSLDGLVLKRPLRREDIKVNPLVKEFMTAAV